MKHSGRVLSISTLLVCTLVLIFSFAHTEHPLWTVALLSKFHFLLLFFIIIIFILIFCTKMNRKFATVKEEVAYRKFIFKNETMKFIMNCYFLSFSFFKKKEVNKGWTRSDMERVNRDLISPPPPRGRVRVSLHTGRGGASSVGVGTRRGSSRGGACRRVPSSRRAPSRGGAAS